MWGSCACGDERFGGELGLQCVCRLYSRVLLLLLFYLGEVSLAFRLLLF